MLITSPPETEGYMRRTKALLLFPAVFFRSCLGAVPTEAPASGGGHATEAKPEDRIRELARALPPGSRLRGALERGERGDGVRYPWMDAMRSEGVRRALVRTEFVWRGKPTAVRVSRIVYSSEYEPACAQISDPQRLSRVRTSGLEGRLGDAAIARTLSAHWLLIHGRHGTKHGIGIIELLADEWLPRRPDILAPAPKAPDRFREAVDMEDVAAVTALFGSVTREERDSALWAALLSDDPCLFAAILKRSANVNLRNQDGESLLMAAARHGALANAKALLAAGADVGATAPNGETALSIAVRLHDDRITELLRQSGAHQ